MKARMQELWQSRAPRERKVIALVAALLLVVAYALFVLSAERARVPLRASVVALRAQSARLDQQALELGRLRSAPAAATSSGDLHKLIQARINEAGLAHALARIDAVDADHVVVVFGAVAFADWLDFIAGLKGQHLRLEACRIEALSTPGLVSVTVTVAGQKSQ